MSVHILMSHMRSNQGSELTHLRDTEVDSGSLCVRNPLCEPPPVIGEHVPTFRQMQNGSAVFRWHYNHGNPHRPAMERTSTHPCHGQSKRAPSLVMGPVHGGPSRLKLRVRAER